MNVLEMGDGMKERWREKMVSYEERGEKRETKVEYK